MQVTRYNFKHLLHLKNGFVNHHKDIFKDVYVVHFLIVSIDFLTDPSYRAAALVKRKYIDIICHIFLSLKAFYSPRV